MKKFLLFGFLIVFCASIMAASAKNQSPNQLYLNQFVKLCVGKSYDKQPVFLTYFPEGYGMTLVGSTPNLSSYGLQLYIQDDTLYLKGDPVKATEFLGQKVNVELEGHGAVAYYRFGLIIQPDLYC